LCREEVSMKRWVVLPAILALCAGCSSGRISAGPQTYADAEGRQVVVEHLTGQQSLRVTLWDGSVQTLQRKVSGSGTVYRKGSCAVRQEGDELTVLQNELPVFTGKKVQPRRRGR